MPRNPFYEMCIDFFKSLGVASGDIVMLHSDAMILGPTFENLEQKKSLFFEALDNVIGTEGTILVPSFSMSWTKGEVYDVENSPGSTGILSDYFQTRGECSRTHDPIYNFYVSGRLKNEFLGLEPRSCFGAGSVFDKFYCCDGKIICAGCSLDRATFVHHVEEMRGVSYRYYKEFSGDIVSTSGGIVSGSVELYVRDLDLDTFPDHRSLKEQLILRGKCVKASLGRIAGFCVRARDFYDVSIALLDDDEYALIRERSAGG